MRDQPTETPLESVAGLAKALAHPARLRILRFLAEKQGCIGGDIVHELGLAQSTVSEHLRILKAAGIISGEIEHPRICYALASGPLDELSEFLATLQDAARNGSGQCYSPISSKKRG
jgi:ArsR family transcriptional regulator